MPVDPYATALGIASRTILARLLKNLLSKGLITQADVDRVLDGAERELMAHGTEVAAGGVGIVQTIRNDLGKL
jgi:hypothetical protein